MSRRLAAALLAAGVAPMLGGCFAAVAIAVPAATAAGFLSERKRIRAATPRPEPARRTEAVSPGVRLTTLTELPPPSGGAAAGGGDEWQPFIAYAREQAAALKEEGPARSALLTREGAMKLLPDRQACADRTPGVLIDLDAAGQTFSGETAAAAPPGLAAELAGLRDAGVVVLWISRAPAAQVGAIGQALTRSGLDPTGHDPLLLVRNAEQNKQTLREDAARDVCLVALAGDVRGDFDQLFDYLRDPATAAVLESLIGAGWFLVPPPLAAAAAAP